VPDTNDDVLLELLLSPHRTVREVEPPYPVGRWRTDEYGSLVLDFACGRVVATKRPDYCNRGDFLVHLDYDPDPVRGFAVSGADLWPRYLFGLHAMKLQVEEWLRRHRIDPATGDFIQPPAEATR
jgi:hypothetical protein